MKVLNLRCSTGHVFEGWFGSDDDFTSQCQRRLIECPLCGEREVARMPSAPRLNLSGARSAGEATVPQPDPASGAAEVLMTHPAPDAMRQMQALWMHAVREVMNRTEDVGQRFPEEARKIHYGEAQVRGIRGQATPEQRAALQDEGIEVTALPVPKGLNGPSH